MDGVMNGFEIVGMVIFGIFSAVNLFRDKGLKLRLWH